MATQVQELKHDLVDPDPNNPRQTIDEERLAELAADIAINGILQHTTVRPHPTAKGRFMLIFGERRWRAAGMLELPTIPAVVKDVNDQVALLMQVAENDKREGLHPLEEADAYRKMHERDGREVEEIAELTGKTRAYIYASMKLCALAPEPRKAFLAGKLDKSRALLIARLPLSQQKQASDEIANHDDDEPVSYRDAAHHIRTSYMLRLANAPFKLGDGLLVAKAGPCTICPKRTGNQQELFADVIADRREGGADVCTDAPCYKEKVEAHWLRVKNEAEARGQQALDGREGHEAGGYSDKKLIDLDRTAHDLGEHDKTYREVLGKVAKDAVSVVARAERGQIKELVPRSELPALLKEAGLKVKKETNDEVIDKADRAAKERNERERLVTATITEAVLAKVDEASLVDSWRLIARMVVRACSNDAHQKALKANNLAATKESPARATLILFVNQELKSVAQLRNFAVELLLAETRGWIDAKERGLTLDDDSGTNLGDAAQLLGIDVDAIVKKVKDDMAAAAKVIDNVFRHKKTCPIAHFDLNLDKDGGSVSYKPKGGGATSAGAGYLGYPPGEKIKACPKCDGPLLAAEKKPAKKNGVAAPAVEAQS